MNNYTKVSEGTKRIIGELVTVLVLSEIGDSVAPIFESEWKKLPKATQGRFMKFLPLYLVYLRDECKTSKGFMEWLDERRKT